MSDDIDAILNSLFRNGKLNLNQSKTEKTEMEKTLEEMEQVNKKLSQSLQSSIAALSRDVNEAAKSEVQPAVIFPEENENVHIAQLSKAKPDQDDLSLTEKLHQNFKIAEEAVRNAVIGQDDFVSSLALVFRRPFVTGIEGDRLSAAVVIIGQNGTGRHMALEKFTEELAKTAVFASERINQIDLGKYKTAESEKVFVQDLYSASKNDAQVLVFENFEKAHNVILTMVGDLFVQGKVLLSGRYAEQKGMLVDIGTALVPGAVSSLSMAGKYLFLLTDQNESSLLDAFGASFLKACHDVCRTEPFSSEDIREIARRELEKFTEAARKRLGYRLSFDDSAVQTLASKFITDEGADSLQAYMALLHKALSEYKLRDGGEKREGTLHAAGKELEVVFQEQHISIAEYAADIDREKSIQAVKEGLHSIIGLAKVKEYILSLEDHLHIQQIRREQGLKTDFPSMHMIFTGNPGTGKTTVARLVSRYLKAIGVLSGGQLVEVTRADLVGKYVGHTAPLTQKAIASALGGVLFIDEAYSLFRGNDDSFGLEAIDTLVKGMEDHRDDLVVILAGYTVEMESFLTANSGLRSRFPNIIEFEDYTAEELLAISKSMVKAKGYRMEEACDVPLLAYYERMQSREDVSTGGNARMARNKIEEAILNCSRRSMATKAEERNLELLKLEDFHLEDD